MKVRLFLAVWIAVFSAAPSGLAAEGFSQFADRQFTSLKGSGITYGAVILNIDTGRAIYVANPDLPLAPASNQKILTTVGALATLGLQFQFTTILARWNDDLVVIGDGDPGFGDPNLCESRPVSGVFDQWAALLADAGMTAIPGKLIFDDTIFDRNFIHPNWPTDQINRWYAAPVGGLNLNDNCLDLSVAFDDSRKPHLAVSPETEMFLIVPEWTPVKGPQTTLWPFWENSRRLKVKIRLGARGTGPAYITVKDPTQFFAGVCRERLQAGGITVQGAVVRGRVRKPDGSLPDNLTILARHTTSMRDVVRRANTNSQNFFAECLFKRVGYQSARGHASFGAGTWTTGQLGFKEFLQDQVKVSLDPVVIDDGSGLSKNNRLTAEILARLLLYALRQPWGEEFRATLAVTARPDGTLRRRMRGTAAAGKVQAKTGTINGVNALSGYVLDPQDRPRVIFALLFNYPRGSGKGWQAKTIEDKICITLAQMLANRPAATQDGTDNETYAPGPDEDE